MPEQVITLVAASARIFADVKTTEVKPMQMAMLDYFAEKRSDLINRLRDGKVLTDEIKESIIETAKEFKAGYKISG